jgi:hypothetical protein
MGIRFRKDGEIVDSMGNLEVPPSHEQKHYHYDGGNPPSKHPDDIKEGKTVYELPKLNPQYTKEYDDSFRGKVDDFINPGQDINIHLPENNLKALLAIREELVEVKLENKILTSKLKQIYLITNSN